MTALEKRFEQLLTEHAPGQETRYAPRELDATLRGEALPGRPVDFSHGDVNNDAFAPTPGALDEFMQGVERGGEQAYTEYRGEATLREILAQRLAAFTGAALSGQDELIITPGTQGALFLAVAASVAPGDKVAIVRPDYFANRKLVAFMGGEIVPVQMDYLHTHEGAGLRLDQLEDAFRAGVRTFLFSNPNNPAGVVYSQDEIDRIAALANRYGVTVIVDQLYSRLRYGDAQYTHMCARDIDADKVVTIMGPSKTESLSGYRLGVAFGPSALIDRMEKVQAIATLRAPGYCQAILRTWFAEPDGWLRDRIAAHQRIRDDLLAILRHAEGLVVRTPQAGSYVFPRLPALDVPLHTFVYALRLQAGVTVTPGTEFSPDAGDSVRLNFSQNHEAAVQAVERLSELLVRYRR